MLTVGVALTQLSKTQSVSETDEKSTAKLFTGFMTVMVAICLSGFAGEILTTGRCVNTYFVMNFLAIHQVFTLRKFSRRATPMSGCAISNSVGDIVATVYDRVIDISVIPVISFCSSPHSLSLSPAGMTSIALSVGAVYVSGVSSGAAALSVVVQSHCHFLDSVHSNDPTQLFLCICFFFRTLKVFVPMGFTSATPLWCGAQSSCR